MRLDLCTLLHSSLHPLQACRGSRHCEVAPCTVSSSSLFTCSKLHGLARPSLEAALLQKRRILLSPVLSGISGSVQAQVESCDLALITRLKVLDGNLHVDWPCGLGIESTPFGLQPTLSCTDLVCPDCLHTWSKSLARTPMERWRQNKSNRESVFISLPTSLAL